MATLDFDIGDVIQLKGTFTTSTGGFVDPTAVTMAVLPPPPSTSYQYTKPSSTSITHPSSGVYLLEVPISSSGVWQYRITSTGSHKASEEGYFRVRSRRVT